MTESGASDEMLMAYVDGELEPAAAAALAAALAADPTLAARAEGFRRSRRLAKAAFAGLLAADPPARLSEALADERGTATVRRLRPWRPRYALPLAASLLLAAGLGGFLLGRGGVVAPEAAGGLLAAQPELLAALEGRASGEQIELGEGASLRILGSYPVAEGVCRAFALQEPGAGLRGLGCRRDGAWRVELAVSEPGADGYAPASAGAAESLEAYLEGLGAGTALTPEQEGRALATGWGE